MEQFKVPEHGHFTSPEEEIAFLREALRSKKETVSSTEVLKETIASYKETAPSIEVSLPLTPESHDSIMEDILVIIMDKGIVSALKAVEALHNPHLLDDFHRLIVQYVIHHGLPKDRLLKKLLDTVVYEVTIPQNTTEDFKKSIAVMEQFLAAMQYIGGGSDNTTNDSYSIEIAYPEGKSQAGVYISIPKKQHSLFEKQVLAAYPQATVSLVTDDYNMFVMEGSHAGAYGLLQENSAFSLKTYEAFEADPLQSLLGTFAKTATQGEGMAVQFVIRPQGDAFIKKFSHVLEKAKKGDSLKEKTDFAFLGQMAKELVLGHTSKKEETEKEPSEHIEHIEKKLSATILGVTIRLVTSAQTPQRATQLLQELMASFAQYTLPRSNRFDFLPIPEKKQSEFFEQFIFRHYNESHVLPLNLKELATIAHFPQSGTKVKSTKSGTSASPETNPSGILLGYNIHQGESVPVYIQEEDRMRHLYVIGQTGTGKTSILKNLIAQDIARGDGCCYIDPHGSDIMDILSYIPKERLQDVIYFDPASTERPMGLNMLEYDTRFPEQKTFVVNEMLQIFNQLFDMKVAGGAMFEQYFRNAALLVMEDPESGSTLIEITRVLQDKAFRDKKLAQCKNPIIIQFWSAAEATSGEQGLQNFVPYISSKFDPLVSNDIMRPVIGQQHSAINFREIMDKKKILLVNLSKGRLGEINANLIGLILVGKLQMAALSRADSFGAAVPNFYLYIDEFQNVTTPAITSILSEARKYRLSLTVAHQYIGQLPEQIKQAVFGNVGSMAIFRVSPEDATVFEAKLAPTFTAQDISKLDNRNAYASLIINGAPTPHPFNIVSADNPQGNPALIEKLKLLSALTYGRPREEVEAEILEKFRL
jgi:hypothetical protein